MGTIGGQQHIRLIYASHLGLQKPKQMNSSGTNGYLDLGSNTS